MEVIQALIDACPDAILERDAHGWLPIQHMLVFRRRLKYARALINANPAGLKLLDNRGDLPLHVAVQNPVDVETFTLILQGYPEACKVQDSYNRIPLEFALTGRYGADNVDFEVIEALVRAFPDSLKMKDLTGDTFLFPKICEKYGSQMTEQFIWFLKDNCQEVFQLPGHGGFLPLHCVMRACCTDGQPAGQPAALHMTRASPEAARVASDDRLLPLHYIPGYSNAMVSKALVDAYPDAVVTKCRAGRTPLHCLLSRIAILGNTLEVVKVLATARPSVLALKDIHDDTPLATAIRRGVNLPTVEWLLEALPDSMEVANNDLQIPLHIAASRGRWCSVEVVRAVY